ncbi:6-phosphogluconate dehydratase [Gammaproteobacteria bacterium]|nr:6-phosphogluconate dehydratase [Gammaproteobacteria bacterium]
MNKNIKYISNSINKRSETTHNAYVRRMQSQASFGKTRSTLSCGNLAHAIAACSLSQKNTILDSTRMNVGIISAYNDMLSAHAPYQHYPDQIKKALLDLGHSAQVAGGVPAMCDGVTQGQAGMDLSLFSRDLIAQATALSLSHNTFDATLLLGICDKIAPGQLIGALSFGHLPTAFVPSGPMSTGISNDEKVMIRGKYAEGKLNKNALQDMENRAYHAPGTCTFYGTANTNQLVFEAMGLMPQGSAFIPYDSGLRIAMTKYISQNIINARPLYQVVNAASIVNGLVALLASGGSTNHTLHMIAIARAAGIIITWEDFNDLSKIVPSLTSLYPNGPADINAFEQAGGTPTLMKALMERGLLNMDAKPIWGDLADYAKCPVLEQDKVVFVNAQDSNNASVISTPNTCFSEQGGLRLLSGNCGRGIIKISAVAAQDRIVEAPAMVFESQHDVEKAYQAGLMNKDVIVVLRHNGPAANGMPELHKLMPLLSNLMKLGFKVALVTDGRLSGASGKVPAAIHITPEAALNGPLSLIKNGDIIRLDADNGTLETTADLSERIPFHPDLTSEHSGSGRELFQIFRKVVSSADTGASIF